MSVASRSKARSISVRSAFVQGSAPKTPYLRLDFPWIETGLFEAVQQGHHIARRHHDDVGLKVVDQVNLTLGHAAGHGDDDAAQALGAVVRAQPSGKEPVAVGDVHFHAGPSAGGAQRARDHVRPHVDIRLGVADHDRFTRRPRRTVQTRQPFLGNGEHAEGIIVSEIRLDGERELGQIRQLPKVGRMHAAVVESSAVVRHMLVDMPERARQSLPL